MSRPNDANSDTKYWGNNYSYDAWGNLLGKSVTKCTAENLSLTVLANNQLSGYGYDAAGNNYSSDAENRITGAAGYTLYLRCRRKPVGKIQRQHRNDLLVETEVRLCLLKNSTSSM